MKLKDILRDQEKGSGELLRQVVAWLQKHPDALDEVHLGFTLALLRKTRPSMAGFAVLADRIERGIADAMPLSPLAMLQAIGHEIYAAERDVARRFTALLRERAGAKVVTLSFSSAVVRALREAGELVRGLDVLESKPGAEGRRLSEAATDLVEHVHLVPDADLDQAAGRADLGVIGVDTVFADGAVLNKILSARLGEALREQKKPLYALATSWKHTAEASAGYRVDPHDAGLFEIVPAALITQLITEE